MKQKILSLLAVIGCALGLFTAGSIGGFLGYVFCLLGGFCFIAGVMFFTSVYGGKVWGIKIPKSSIGKKLSMLSIPALIMGGYGLGCVIMCLFTFRIPAIIGLVLFIIGIIASIAFTKKFSEKSVANSDNALCLGEIELFKQIDKEIKNASYFVVGFEVLRFLAVQIIVMRFTAMRIINWVSFQWLKRLHWLVHTLCRNITMNLPLRWMKR